MQGGNDVRRNLKPPTLTRRRLLKAATALGSAYAVGGLSAACGSSKKAGDFTVGPDMDAARTEGKLVLWHADQEADVVKFLADFTKKTGIEATQLRVTTGTAVPRLEEEADAGVADVDIYNCSDIGVLHRLRKKDLLQKYVSDEMKVYPAEYKSDPAGFWTTYYINDGPILYFSSEVDRDKAPKDYMDLLDPMWKGKLCFQDATAGSQFTWWYLLKDHLPDDYFDRLAELNPTAYPSSTAQIQELRNGNEKIGGKVSSFQYTKAKRQGLPVEVVYPEIGVPTATQGSAIIKTTQRPNAAKAFIDYMISRKGQQIWNGIQGSNSAHPKVKTKDAFDVSNVKLLLPDAKSIDEYASADAAAEFQKLWKIVTG